MTLAASSQRHLAQQARRYATRGATVSKIKERSRVIFSGILPTGVLHVGNYLLDPELYNACAKTEADDDLEIQTHHTNDESEIDESTLNAGLFTYSILHAADINILAYRATHVPVGEDQTQRLDLSRYLAESFNRTFAGKKRFLPVPTQMIIIVYISSASLSMRLIPSQPLRQNIQVSSKHGVPHPAYGHQVANSKQQFRSALTGSIQYISYDPVNRPSTSNLLNILAACTNEKVEKKVAKRRSSKNHSGSKAAVGEAVENMRKQPWAAFHRLKEDKNCLDAVAKEGTEKAKERTSRLMTGVRKLVGLC